MGTNKIKGFYKGFKFITQIFVVKERELEIGFPTDVKHVAHIGWDGASGNPPSWMSEYKTAPEFSSSKPFGGAHGVPRESNSMSFSPWSSQDFSESMGLHQIPASAMLDQTVPSSDPPSIPKKQKRKKKSSSSASTSSPSKGSSSSSSSLSKALRSSKANNKAVYHELEPTMIAQA